MSQLPGYGDVATWGACVAPNDPRFEEYEVEYLCDSCGHDWSAAPGVGHFGAKVLDDVCPECGSDVTSSWE